MIEGLASTCEAATDRRALQQDSLQASVAAVVTRAQAEPSAAAAFAAAKQHHGKSMAAAAARRRERPRRTGTTLDRKAASYYSQGRPLDAQCRLRQDDGHGQIPKGHGY